MNNLLTFRCADHGEQELKDALMSDVSGLILELDCSCIFQLARAASGKITHRRLTLTKGTAKAA